MPALDGVIVPVRGQVITTAPAPPMWTFGLSTNFGYEYWLQRQDGRIVVCGATSGPNPPAALHRLWWKQLDLLGSSMGTREDFEGAYDLVASGATPVIDSVLPLSEARAAHERLESGEQFGKIILSIPD